MKKKKLIIKGALKLRVFFIMIFFLRKLAVCLFMSSFFIMMQAQAGIVEPIYKQLKDPTTGGQPSTVSMSITPDRKSVV